MPDFLAHQKQYILGPAPVRLRSDWMASHISDQLVLSHCPKLSTQELQSQDGRRFWLLGLAVAADEVGDSLSTRFRTKDFSDIEEWTGYWAGKWALMSADRCWQDASGSLGLNYRVVDDQVWLSSSPALLGSHLPDAPHMRRIPWQVGHAKGMDWIPAPLTSREGVRKVLPQRSIDPRDGSIRPVRMARPNKDLSDAFDTLGTTLKTIMVNWSRCAFSDRLVGLTAGLDTRTVLAAACAAKIDVRAYTMNFPFMKRRDRVLPPRLAASVGVPHVFRTLPPAGEAEVKARAAIIAEHMDGATTHPTFDHYARFIQARPGDHLRTSAHGSCFEIGRCFFWDRFSRFGLEQTHPSAEQILDVFSHQTSWRPEPRAAWRMAIGAWLDSLSESVPIAPDWRDRFYLDQRLGAWNAAVQRAGDFIDSNPFSPANCLWVFHLLLQPDPSNRKAGTMQREIIRLLEPRLARFPINPQSMSERLARNARGLVRRTLGRTSRAMKKLLKADRAR